MGVNDLIIRVIGDPTSLLKSNEAVISSNTMVGRSALAMGADFEKSAAAQVASIEKAITAQRAQLASIQALKAKSSGATLEAATIAETTAQSRLNRTLGESSVAYGRTSAGAKHAEDDLNKLTRGALAGSGVFSSMGRSLAFASSAFIGFSVGGLALSTSIKDAETFDSSLRSVDATLTKMRVNVRTFNPQLEKWAQDQQRLGVSTIDATKGFATLIAFTHNATTARQAYTAALEISRVTGRSLSSVELAAAKATQGQTSALARYIGTIPKGTTFQEEFNRVQAKFGGQALANTTASDRFSAALTNLETDLGVALLPTFDRLVNHFSAWLSKMEQSGRLQRDFNEVVRDSGYVFHTLGDVISHVDDVTGSFLHTVELLLALELASKLRGIAVAWGLVGTAATEAGAAQTAALAETAAATGTAGAAGAAGGGGGLLAGLGAGGLLGRLSSKLINPPPEVSGVVSRVGMYTGAEAAGATLTTAGIGALAVAAFAATAALTKLATVTGDKLGAGSTYDKSLSAVEGFFTGGLFGNKQFGPLHSIFGAVLHGQVPFENALKSTFQTPTPPFHPQSYYQQQFGLTNSQLFGPVPSRHNFGGVQPMTQYWKQFVLTFKEQMAQAQSALTQSTADDVAAARQVVARIKTQLAEGNIHGPALFQALALEASAYQTIWSAEAAQAQKRAAAAAAAKAKILAEIENSINPLSLQLELAVAQAKGDQKGIIAALKKQRAAAEKALATEKLTIQQKIEAENQITSLNQQILAAQTTAAKTFTQSTKLQIALAKAQAFGGDTTKVLKEMKAAALRALRSGKYAGQALVDLLNQITSINSQLQSQTSNAYGDYKKASVKAETAGLGLTPAQRRALEARLARRGPGGTIPMSGVGAAGYIIDPDTGRPVKIVHHPHGSSRTPASSSSGGTPVYREQINIKIELDGKQVTKTVTINQQKNSRRNPSQRRGPNAGVPSS
jgi:hypothetical protein